MPSVTRLGDYCTGHQCWPPRPSITASENVFVNNKGIIRLTDMYDKHCCGSCHTGVLSSGSPNVFANNKKIGRIGDDIDCGSKVRDGSPNVFANN